MIRKLRKKKGLSQSELAKKLHLSETHVSRMERKVKGYRASYSTIKLLAKELEECPLKFFIFFADIDCEYIKLDTRLNINAKCEFEHCINYDLINILRLTIPKELRRLRIENAKLKRQLRRQRQAKSTTFYAYRKRNGLRN